MMVLLAMVAQKFSLSILAIRAAVMQYACTSSSTQGMPGGTPSEIT